ncbi:phosphoglycerate kinase [Rhizobium rhizogenes]|uniref:phosphoglycerate kinase n=1 Tax=Rhizobium rhizogenes TaxID=359 RepID=UPI0004D595EB|nr:phosphoglycerate kinase [Rhizobium rhizogenes]KEA05811.1 phosphoglycerate kinase [Rhizobium rhizogenes]MQB32396.1 phosphoglycerate kinase [Rhizobium rhizogenes]NTF69117.1 phosphoglycerate kinase [Rhizobium rhizogenes]NTI81783.1 phosphoglycerate kinase [Rhizobium rhizogenes]NTJ23969.1 phosphoglycerate kinase [Rhizobium rhizogenes]
MIRSMVGALYATNNIGFLPMAAFKTLDDLTDITGKRVLVRVDLNVPVKDGKVTDATRIERVAPTILELSGKGAKVILLAHFGRPKDGPSPDLSLSLIIPAVEEVLDHAVLFASDCVGAPAAEAVAKMGNGDILLLENTRFHKEEEKNDAAFTKALAANGDIYVNDAFSAAHRAHASTEGLAHLLPAYAGRTMQGELTALEKGLGNPVRPVVAIVGGAKVSSKIDLLKNLVHKVDALVIGGGMANTFLAANGIDVGKSLCEHDLAETAKQIISEAKASNCQIVLPTDGVVASEFKAGAANEVVAIDAIPADAMVLDVGPKSIEAVKKIIEGSTTLVWNGPLGAFEITPFDAATVAAAQYAAERTKAGKLTSVAGGGDTVSALNHAGVADDFTYVSTAGGAFLEWMEGKVLPGVAVLQASK